MTRINNPAGRIALRLTQAFAAALATAAGFLAWQHFYPVQAAEGWRYRVVHEDVKKAAALGIDKDGNLLVSQELRDGQGSIISIDGNGKRTVLVNGLTKPDGLTPFMGGFAFSQETANAPVALLKDGTVTDLFTGNSAQGLKADGPLLYTIEDRKGDGRLMRYDARDQSLTVLRDGLSETESFEICPGDRRLYTVKEAGLVRQMSEDKTDPVFLRGLKEPTFLLCDKRGLWIVEDQTHMARLWLLGPDGELRVVLSHLRAPQELMPVGEDRYLLAEGGRDRVIELGVDGG